MIAMAGTSDCVTLAMRRTPPKMTRAVSRASTMPITHGSQATSLPVVEVTAAVMVLACSELKANGKQTMSTIAKRMPAQRALRPRCM
jgi:hypothetical protein